jgi:predicted Zn-ribbon and HTH transcriptional regulator
MRNEFGAIITFLEWDCTSCGFKWRTYDEAYPVCCPNCKKSFQEIQDEAMKGSE